MIRFEHVTKTYPDGTVAVDDLTLEVPEGEVVVLVGPSGCGKTTTMRMVNRLVEPSSGTVSLGGSDVTSIDAPQLRRGIGYVIQQIGLFPHKSIADNIATVPRLLGWDEHRVGDRVDELIELVGLPAAARDRYPHQLSGGQRQRVGVARALAADPPVLLMDEPFGAVDPIVRARLQREFLDLQSRVRKTIVFVTHDIDEAIAMGDRVAILAEGGVLAQYETPERVLAAPANVFVEAFLGEERGLKRLALISAADLPPLPGPVVTAGAAAAEAHRAAAATGHDWVAIVASDGRLLGWAGLDELAGTVSGARARPFATTIRHDTNLRTALDALVTNPTGVAVRVDAEGRYEGLLTRQQLTESLA